MNKLNVPVFGIENESTIKGVGHSKINNKIVDLWNKYFKGREDVYAPLFYNELTTGALLFVGVNPSFSPRGFNSVLKDTEYKDINPETFFTWKNISSNPKYIEDCLVIDRYAFDKHSYFKRMEDISKRLDIPWYHIDTFLYRETSQKDFISKIYTKSKLNDFGRDQLEIFKELLHDTKPKAVVIANAFASGVIQQEFKDKLSYSKEKGYHHLILNDVSIPIFFTSMLTGQRALDTGSYERLVWHIRKAVTNSDGHLS